MACPVAAHGRLDHARGDPSRFQGYRATLVNRRPNDCLQFNSRGRADVSPLDWSRQASRCERPVGGFEAQCVDDLKPRRRQLPCIGRVLD
jgi:hypothetical protein